MFLAAAICPYLAPKSVVSTSLDALINIAGEKVNIHVLMALAAFASVFMGNALEGGLLLAMFNLAHIGFSVLQPKCSPQVVPVDCQIFKGSATITIEHLTGEAKPIEAKVGDWIPASWCKELGWLNDCQACRGSIFRAIGSMMAASPRALAVAPFAYSTAISSYAKKGIVLKGGQVLDALASCHTNAFDKSGRLTTGGCIFKAIEPILGHQVGKKLTTHATSCCKPSCERKRLLLQLLWRRAQHILLGDHSTDKDLPSEYFPGRGLVATRNDTQVANFNSPCHGDHGSSARRVAQAVGICQFHYSLKPEDKLNHVKTRDIGGGLIMVGEAINDAAALAAATVGIVLAQCASANCHSCGRCSVLPSLAKQVPWFFNTEVGALLKCLNLVRALNDPKWSWKEDMQHSSLAPVGRVLPG
ncbi:unnamed protein product [Linum tenue]|nr:unnamed protein product [Linum tenue]